MAAGEVAVNTYGCDAETTPNEPLLPIHPCILTPVLYSRKLVSNHQHVITCRINLTSQPLPADWRIQKRSLITGFHTTRLLYSTAS